MYARTEIRKQESKNKRKRRDDDCDQTKAQRLRRYNFILFQYVRSMGGSSSRFDETDWNKADGKCEQTIDNAPPTDRFGIYYLTKLGVNQREYNVTDSDSNLLYRTRVVEGTLAWFDVLGPAGEDDYRLQVQVDLSRRYWVVYHYGVPAFSGQMWDENATERLSYRGGWRKPLFRRACITVTWSRYHAVVDIYESAPPLEQDGKEDEGLTVNEETEKEDDDCNESTGSVVDEDKSAITDSRASTNKEPDRGADDNMIGKPIHEQNVHPNSQSEDLMNASGTEDIVNSQCGSQDVSDATLRDSASLPLHVALQSTVKEAASGPGTCENINCQKLDRTSSLGASIRWVQSKAMETVAPPYRPSNIEEGVITLDNPVLKVQEINSIVGKHQTMLISKEEGRKLKREEFLMEAKLIREAQQGSATGLGDEDDPLDDLWHEYSHHTSESEDDTSRVGNNSASVNADADGLKNLARSDSSGLSSAILNVCSDSCLLLAPSQNELETMTKVTSIDENVDEQPLVGFWSWENSLRVHRMKMHVARGSDLALHVVLAVVTNQLRYERHATVAVAL